MRVFDPPDAYFSIELPGLDNPRTLIITHDGGESIEARELFVRGNNITEGYTGAFHEIPDSGFEADDDVSPGDTLDVTIQDEAYDITVEWVSAETGDSTVYTQASRGEMQSG